MPSEFTVIVLLHSTSSSSMRDPGAPPGFPLGPAPPEGTGPEGPRPGMEVTAWLLTLCCATSRFCDDKEAYELCGK